MTPLPWPDEVLPDDKTAARARARERLKERPAQRAEPWNMLASQVVLPAGTWAAYQPLSSEALLAFAPGQAVGLAHTLADRSLVFVRWDGVVPQVKDALGMWAPPRGKGEVADGDIRVVFVPGLAFDAQGLRLGRGAGCYDRTLARISHALRVAVTFEVSLFARVPTAPHDEAVDLIVTERRVHWTGSRQRTADRPLG